MIFAWFAGELSAERKEDEWDDEEDRRRGR